jgi:hypothetical protein
MKLIEQNLKRTLLCKPAVNFDVEKGFLFQEILLKGNGELVHLQNSVWYDTDTHIERFVTEVGIS